MHRIEFIRGLQGLRSAKLGCVATIGAFDGVHLGHQKLLAQLKQAASELGLPAVVVVFEPQPNEYFNRQAAPARLMRLREKVRALENHGIDRVLCLKFDSILRNFSAQEFVQRILVDGLGVKHCVVGDDFRFGCDRLGDFAFLQAKGAEQGFTVADTNTHCVDRVRISSTRARALLAEGDVENVRALLGGPYANYGRVKYGKQLGRTIGFPTVNIGLGRLRVPVQGVFLVELLHAGSSYCGMANVGTRPTVSGQQTPVLEAHIFDFDKNIYGDFVQVNYLKKIRNEQKFASIKELTQQIEQDADVARAYFQNF